MKQELIFTKLIDLVDDIKKDHTKNSKLKKHDKKHKHPKDSDGHSSHRKKHENRTSPVSKKILCSLLEENNLNQRTLAKNCRVSGQAISESLKKMEEKELIIRIQGEINNENLISLSNKGKERALQIQQKTREKSIKLFEEFSPEELDTFLNLLNKIEKNKENMIVNDINENKENG